MKTRLIYLLLIFFSLQFTLLAQTDRKKLHSISKTKKLPAALKKNWSKPQVTAYCSLMMIYRNIQ